jgi:hypothetical protein
MRSQEKWIEEFTSKNREFGAVQDIYGKQFEALAKSRPRKSELLYKTNKYEFEKNHGVDAKAFVRDFKFWMYGNYYENASPSFLMKEFKYRCEGGVERWVQDVIDDKETFAIIMPISIIS